MNCDSYFEIGTNHEHCQDYILHEKIDNFCFLIGSDGCSSSPQSDVGARLLCHAARTKLLEMIKLKEFECSTSAELQFKLQNSILHNIEVIKNMLTLDIETLDATLNIVVINEKGYWWFMWGDGGIIFKFNNESLIYRSIEYSSNAPYYLSYRLDAQREKAYKELLSKEYTLNSIGILDGNVHGYTEMSPNTAFHLYSKNEELSSITICSDGVLSYTIDKIDVIQKMLAYKSFAGEFVQRRMLKLKKEFQKENVTHYDDIFCGTINCNE